MASKSVIVFPSPLFLGCSSFLACWSGALRENFHPLLFVYPEKMDGFLEVEEVSSARSPNPPQPILKEKTAPQPKAVFQKFSLDQFPFLESMVQPFVGDSFIFLEDDDFFNQFQRMGFLKIMDRIHVFIFPTVRSLQKATKIKNRLSLLGIDPGFIQFFRFSFGMGEEIALPLMEREIGEIKGNVILEMSQLLLAENTGASLSQLAPRSKMVRSIWTLASKIKKECEASIKPSDSGQGGAMRGFHLEEWIQKEFWSHTNYEELAGDHHPDKVWEKCEAKLARVLPASLTHEKDPEFWSILKQSVLDHVMGLGPLEDLMRDGEVGEVMVNGPSRLYYEKKGIINLSPKKFASEAQLRVVIDRIVGPSGKRVDSASPCCDVRLPCGSRVNVILPPLSLDGPVVTIRRFKNSYFQIEDLLRSQTLTQSQAQKLEVAVKGRWNIVVAGNSGSGKTTLLNILSHWILDEERIITMEDAAELKIQKPHLVRLETRPQNMEGRGEIKLQDLLINALRMRPDRLILGECRGAEAVSMLQALNTGHDGSMTTLHSNSAQDALERLEGMILLGAPHWPTEVIRRQVAAAIHMIVYLKRTGEHRRCTEMVRLKYTDGQIELDPL